MGAEGSEMCVLDIKLGLMTPVHQITDHVLRSYMEIYSTENLLDLQFVLESLLESYFFK